MAFLVPPEKHNRGETPRSSDPPCRRARQDRGLGGLVQAAHGGLGLRLSWAVTQSCQLLAPPATASPRPTLGGSLGPVSRVKSFQPVSPASTAMQRDGLALSRASLLEPRADGGGRRRRGQEVEQGLLEGGPLRNVATTDPLPGRCCPLLVPKTQARASPVGIF